MSKPIDMSDLGLDGMFRKMDRLAILLKEMEELLNDINEEEANTIVGHMLKNEFESYIKKVN